MTREDVRDDDRVFTNQDPARPGGKGSAAGLAAVIGAFIVIILFFLYALRTC